MSAFRVNETWLPTAFKLLAQTFDEDIHDITGRGGIEVIKMFPNIRARNNFTGSEREVLQQRVLAGRQDDLHAIPPNRF